MTTKASPLPTADAETGLEVLRRIMRTRSLLTALTVTRKGVGNAFQITLPVFKPAVFAGPSANKQILVKDRNLFKWRSERDPVTKLLRNGILVTDGELHDELREKMTPSLQRKYVTPYIGSFWERTDQIIRDWQDGQVYDMLPESRKIALLILFDSLFNIDFTPHMERLWDSILDLLEYISPGAWIFWPEMPRPKYRKAIKELDHYFYSIIRARRETIHRYGDEIKEKDLLTTLVQTPGMSDSLIRDQLLTMFIAGHDTSTALLAWALYLMGENAHAMAKARIEAENVIGNLKQPPTMDQINQLEYLDKVIKETLRLYPPIHVGNRIAKEDMVVQDYHVPEGTRVMCSIYLSHHDDQIWDEPERFDPERFDKQNGEQTPPLSYIPFGGGPRNCIGAAFAQVEAKVVLAHILGSFQLQNVDGHKVQPHMGATLEPRPGVMMRVWRRRKTVAIQNP